MTKALRRKRGTAMHNVQLNTSVPEEQKIMLFTIAQRANISASEAMELILSNVHSELSSDGLPSWFERSQLPEALPISKAS